MHELSLAEGVLRLVEEAAAREHFRRVAELHLEVGALAGVEVSALRFALCAIAPRTALEGARIEIDEPAGRARCLACGAEAEIRSRLDPCPQCGGVLLPTQGGDALRVVDLLVLD